MNIKKLLIPENMSSTENEREANVCPTCEGTGRVVVTKEDEMYSDYCEDCCGEGVIKEDEPSFELQDEFKKQLNNQSWKQLLKNRNKNGNY